MEKMKTRGKTGRKKKKEKIKTKANERRKK